MRLSTVHNYCVASACFCYSGDSSFIITQDDVPFHNLWKFCESSIEVSEYNSII